MKKSLVLCIVLAFLFISLTNAFAVNSSDIPQEVLNAAKDGLEIVKGNMASNPALWGFSNTGDIENLTLGEGFYVNYIDSTKVLNSDSKSMLDRKSVV